ncbi:MAG: CAMP factor family pore-forming toxin [Eubacteriales bacterium]|nr:CAMP factor family pore-forming toxin [Eubacteriales bacterium]
MKKLLAIFLAAMIFAGILAPAVQASEKDAKEVEIILEDIRELEPQNGIQKRAYDKLMTETENFQEQVRYNPDTIYDLDSIAYRVLLLGKLGEAMRFATTELVDKVDAAHTKIAGYIFAGLVHVANPFNRVEELEDYGHQLEVVKAECLAMPDMSPEDTANLYKRAALDELLHEARFLKFNELKNKDGETIKTLDKVIREVTKTRLKPQTTVAEIEHAKLKLVRAIEEAKIFGGQRASRSAVAELRKLVREARSKIVKARIKGENVEELEGLYNIAFKEIMKIRPSARIVRESTETLTRVLSGNGGVIIIQ